MTDDQATERDSLMVTELLPEAMGAMPAATFKEAAKMLGPLARSVRIEVSQDGFRFVAVGDQDEDAGDLFLSHEVLDPFEVRQAGACILEVSRLQDFARVPQRKQAVRFELDSVRGQFRFTVGHLTRTMLVRPAERELVRIPEGSEEACPLCHNTGILDTRRHSYPCPRCARGVQVAS
jgi:hypothetical protein